MKNVEIYDLLKVPDSVIIKELRKSLSALETEKGKLVAYILELEDKIKNQEKSFHKEILSIQKKHTRELKECQELNNKVSGEERKAIKAELVHTEILSSLKSKNAKLKRQLKDSKISNDQLYSLVARLKNQIEEKRQV